MVRLSDKFQSRIDSKWLGESKACDKETRYYSGSKGGHIALEASIEKTVVTSIIICVMTKFSDQQPSFAIKVTCVFVLISHVIQVDSSLSSNSLLFRVVSRGGRSPNDITLV